MALVSLASLSYEFASLGLLCRVLRASLQTVNFRDDQTWPIFARIYPYGILYGHPDLYVLKQMNNHTAYFNLQHDFLVDMSCHRLVPIV